MDRTIGVSSLPRMTISVDKSPRNGRISKPSSIKAAHVFPATLSDRLCVVHSTRIRKPRDLPDENERGDLSMVRNPTGAEYIISLNCMHCLLDDWFFHQDRVCTGGQEMLAHLRGHTYCG